VKRAVSNAWAEAVLVLVMSGAVLGTVFGFAQWFVLRKQFKRAAVWLLATAVAVSAGMMVAPGVIRALRLFAEPGIVSGAGIAAVFGTILGIITGLPLIWLLRHPKSETWKGSRTDFQSRSVR